MNSITTILFISLILLKHTTTRDHECASVKNEKLTIEWPSTKDRTISCPPCVNEAREFAYRTCKDGEWGPEPYCFYIQPKSPPQCPKDFNQYKIPSNNEHICYKISEEKTPFPPKCPFEDTLPFKTYISSLHFNGSVWMPVHRKKFDYFRWTEASYFYTDPLPDRDYTLNGSLTDKNCLVYENGKSATAVSCDEEHSSLCVYRTFNNISNALCDMKNDCFQSDFSPISKCFCLKWGNLSIQYLPLVQILKPYQNNIFERSTTNGSMCLVGFGKYSDGRYRWGTGQEINYTYWSKDVVFDNEDYINGATTAQGWTLTDVAPCFWFEKSITLPEPQMNLIYMGVDIGFLLIVSNIESLKEIQSDIRFFCFTDAGVNLLTKLEYYGVEGIANQFTFKPLQEGPGNYWCEGFKLSEMKISSNVILHRSSEDFPSEYVIELTHIYKSDENPLGNTYFQDKVLSSEIDPNSKCVFRLEKILNVDEKRSTILMSVHISFKTPVLNISFVKEQIGKAFNNLTVINQLRNSDFCIEEELNGLNWPRTVIGNRAYPKELCFQADSTFLTRSCKGDFSNGGQWEEVENSCEILEESLITEYLLDLLYNKAQENSDLMLEGISRFYSEFSIADMCLVANIFDEMVNRTSGNLDQCAFSKIINNLLEIDTTVLREAQRKFGVLNKILNLINLILGEQHKTDTFETCEHDNANFHFMIITNSLATGVYTQEGDYLDPLQFLPTQTTVKEIKSIPILANAIFMAQNLINQTNLSTKIIFTLFFKHSFFVSESPVVKIAGPVFGFLIHNFDQTFQGSVQIVQKIKKYNKAKCLSWNHGTSAWQNVSLSTYTDPLLLCKFWKNGYFAFTITQDDNVTESLIDILQSKANASEVIKELHTVSENYETFKSTDIELVGKILKKVHRQREIDLEILAKTVNNLHQINRDILLESQKHKSATDMILNYVDQILKNHEYQESVFNSSNNNFMIFMFNINKTNFSGLVLTEEDEKFHIQILTGDIEIDEIAKFNNFSSAVLLDPQLKNQLKDDAKIIITLFPNDAFFNEKDFYAKNVSKIFGIILPSIGKYHGPLTILHKINKSNSHESCSYWKYNETLRGSWSKDHDGKDLSHLVRCDFWHTTHFALLLMDHEGKKDPLLELINHITCGVSLVGLFIIVFTALIFKRWRENPGNKVLLNFSIIDIAQIGLFYASTAVKKDPKPSLRCTIVGVFLHYSVISQCCWMLVIAYLQYKRFVDVLGKLPQNILLKACLCGWGLPLLPVLSVLAFQKDNYGNNSVDLCYPSDWGLYFGIWLPVLIIVIINFIIFVNIMFNIVCKKSDSVNAGSKEKILQCKMGFLLFFMLGLSWGLGIFCEFNLGQPFTYAFVIISNLQGFVLFLFFIAFNVSTRRLYTKAFKIRCSKM